MNVGGYCVANLNIDSYACNLENCIYCIGNNYCGQCAEGYYSEKFTGGKCMKMYSPLPYCMLNLGSSCIICDEGYVLNAKENKCQKLNSEVECLIDGCDYCL